MLLKPVLPVLEYAVNYDYIAKELCVNKAKPQMHCNGKCHLMKELAKASGSEKSPAEKKSPHTETELLFCEAVADFSFTALPVRVTGHNFRTYNNCYSHLNIAAVFHPPLFIS
jgi:hypothetical protein